MPRKPTGKPTGRPPVDIPLDILNTACQFNANTNQIQMLLEAKGIKITDDTLNAFCKRNFGLTFSEYRDKRFDNTRLMLTQKTMKMALEGNVTLLIFCLKNLCKWSDKVEVTAPAPVRDSEVMKLSDEDLDRMLEDS